MRAGSSLSDQAGCTFSACRAAPLVRPLPSLLFRAGERALVSALLSVSTGAAGALLSWSDSSSDNESAASEVSCTVPCQPLDLACLPPPDLGMPRPVGL